MWAKTGDDSAGLRESRKNKKTVNISISISRFRNKTTNLGKRTFAKMVVTVLIILFLIDQNLINYINKTNGEQCGQQNRKCNLIYSKTPVSSKGQDTLKATLKVTR